MQTNILFIIFLITLTCICDTVSQIFLKSSIDSIEQKTDSLKNIFKFIFQITRFKKVWFGFSFNILSLFMWLFVLSKADLNFAFPLDSMHYIFIGIASQIFLKEKLNSKRWTGISFIVAGIILISLSK